MGLSMVYEPSLKIEVAFRAKTICRDRITVEIINEDGLVRRMMALERERKKKAVANLESISGKVVS